ncbi:hypothetical protein [Roseiflexus castenholzii]|uniref:hypothetical protein n=1 Tax=Roseiflexus castenholzii TaxID=120962 RepID=UPI003C7A8D71
MQRRHRAALRDRAAHDEGADGDLDRIQYSTISWMNLLDIYIILAYYNSAEKNQREGQTRRNKISRQMFASECVKEQIEEVMEYKNSVLHWNFYIMETRFVDIHNKALNSYEEISSKTKVLMHDRAIQEKYLNMIMDDFGVFKRLSLSGSKGASLREVRTTHINEHLADGSKARLNIRNYLGGVYYLTADEVIKEGSRYVIQESKNATKRSLPSLDDIKDGIFKLALFSNIDVLMLEDRKVEFSVRLKLTGKGFRETIMIPCSNCELEKFLARNTFTGREKEIIRKLQVECFYNPRLRVQIGPNQ